MVLKIMIMMLTSPMIATPGAGISGHVPAQLRLPGGACGKAGAGQIDFFVLIVLIISFSNEIYSEHRLGS